VKFPASICYICLMFFIYLLFRSYIFFLLVSLDIYLVVLQIVEVV
jgi:hypothetical protein